MKYNIQKWGRLEKKSIVNPYDFGGILSSTVSGVGTGASVGGPWGAAIGGAVGLLGGLLGNKKEKEAKKLQEQQLAQQQMMEKQQQMLAMPQSGGGMPGQFTLGGYLTPELLAKSGIYIKPENKGKFTATKKATGKSTEELTHSKNPLTRKRAIFAQNAKKWKHDLGGPIDPPSGGQGLNTTTPSFTPTDKTQWFPESAALSKYKGLVGQGKQDEADKLIFGYYANEPYGPYQEGTHSEYEKTGRIKPFRAKDLSKLDTKVYKPPKDYNALLEGIGNKSVTGDMDSQQFKNVTLKMAKGGFVNPLATDVTGLVTYNSGGKHSQNPLGGIPLSMGSKGKRNSVEQGESSFKFPEGKYIFSNRLKIRK